ncbi:hypothetical protein Tsubulata_003003 [Turnera subulata]|uniref:Uncharacterized protein n=1 Tax=Turnera subulata TaxID=218843 RepID=A0A9Q0G1M7_9ROSI|nr:hypothetical protein Tsubulata_003003 [Turnera subulata]
MNGGVFALGGSEGPKFAEWLRLNRLFARFLETIKCDAKYTPTHKYAGRQLFLFHSSGEPSDNMSLSDETEFILPIDLAEGLDQPPKVSFNAICGMESMDTMRFQGTLLSQNIHILVDSGSTHNFLDANTALQLNLSTIPITPVPVTVADGSVVCNILQSVLNSLGLCRVTPSPVIFISFHSTFIILSWACSG